MEVKAVGLAECQMWISLKFDIGKEGINSDKRLPILNNGQPLTITPSYSLQLKLRIHSTIPDSPIDQASKSKLFNAEEQLVCKNFFD